MLQQLLGLKELPKTSIYWWTSGWFVIFSILKSGWNEKLFGLGCVKQNEERVKKIVVSIQFFYDQ
jgi:hypothetical protein